MEQSRRIMPTSEQYVVHWQSAVYMKIADLKMQSIMKLAIINL